MSICALDIKHVTKEYKLYEKQIDRLKESFHPFKKTYHKKFYALNDINFKIMQGEKIGIIGANGAGKSTLLKIITGVLNPTNGEIKTNGKIAALLELGAGFNMDYTGIENIRLNATLMGYTDLEIEEKIQHIIDFADIGDFIYQPVKSYSSGMFVRLAFATQIVSEPDILIVDEALSVGDIRFQQKCFRAMESIMKNKTVVLVTHDTAAVTRFCKRIVWINNGQVMYDGEVTEGLKQYQEYLINQAIAEKKGNDGYEEESVEQKLKTTKYNREVPNVLETIKAKGNGKAQIFKFGLYDKNNMIIEKVEPNQYVKCIIHVNFLEIISRPILGLVIRDRLGNEVIGINTETINQILPRAKEKIEYILEFKLPPLNKGEYTISVAIANGYQNDHIQLCWLDDVWIFRIADRKYDIPGMLYLDNGKIEILNLK